MNEMVSFTRMIDGTKEDYLLLERLEQDYCAGLPDRILEALKRLDGSMEGYRISRYEHSLQSATMAEADGADIELIVAALIHDIGDELAPQNHSQLAAAIIKPYVRPQVTWILEMHGLFQMYYFAHHYGKDRNIRDRYKDHRWYQDCVDFCEKWDQTAFDPDYPTKPLEYFAPMVREIFTREPFHPLIVGD